MLKSHSFFYISGHCPTLSNPKPLTLNTMYLLHLCKRVVRKAPRVNCAHVYRAYGADPVNEMSLRAFRLKARGSELLIPRSRCGDVAADSSSLREHEGLKGLREAEGLRAPEGLMGLREPGGLMGLRVEGAERGRGAKRA